MSGWRNGEGLNKCCNEKPSEPLRVDDLSFSHCWPTFLSHFEHLHLTTPCDVQADLRTLSTLLVQTVVHHHNNSRLYSAPWTPYGESNGDPNKAAWNSDMKLPPMRAMVCVSLISCVPFMRSHKIQARIHGEKFQGVWNKHKKSKYKWTRGCSFNSGLSNSFLRWVMPFPEVQSAHYKSDCAFSAIQLPPWLSREPGCTSGNKGHGIKISITITNTGVVHLCVYMADGRLDKTSPDLRNFPSLQPMWRSRSL